jgi:hopanoid biosynthesis associated radical SAM protein HpnH
LEVNENMAIPVSQMWAVATWVLKHKRAGIKRYPLVLMLEPLFRCNLVCAGCGKVQYPPHILKRQLTPAECFAAMDECGAPIVCVPGGEPFLHPNIVEIIEGLVARKRFVYLCTNALELKGRLNEFKPSKYFSFAVHLDGQREHHDYLVCREGSYDIAVEGIREAVKRGFRVTTNSTLFDGADANSTRAFFDEVMGLGVEGMTVSPGFSYGKAPDKDHFLGRARVRRLFRAIMSNRKPTWKFNMSPLFLEFLMGDRQYECTPWGMPSFSIFGWQKPCYLLQEGYAESYKELLETTSWDNYGAASGNPKCANCMVSCGYEATAVIDGFTSLKSFIALVCGNFRLYRDKHARKLLDQAPAPHRTQALVQIEKPAEILEETCV